MWEVSGPRILLLDIETSPHTVLVWDLKPYYISTDQLQKPSRVLCFAAKWLGEKETMFYSGRAGQKAHERMVRAAHRLITEADAVVHYNGTKFDLPTLHREMVELGMTPPSPAVEHDLLSVVRKKFRFASNKLSYVAKRLRLGSKAPHKGLDLWIGCMAGDPKSWKVMERYNRQDITLTERLYYRLRPWMESHINMGLWFKGPARVCPNCGSDKLIIHGVRGQGGHLYRRYFCQSCGAWPRERVNCTPGDRKGRVLA